MGGIDFPGKYQIAKMPIAKIRALLDKIEPDEHVLSRLDGDRRAGVRSLAEKIRRERERIERKRARQQEMCALENSLRDAGKTVIAGIDEAGRGPLAGPVVAAAVILPAETDIPGIDDSKKLSARKREYLFDEITERAEAWGIGMVDNEEIDAINILEATMDAMRAAMRTMKAEPDVALVDGNRAPDLSCDARAVVDGDARCRIIAAASIIAKVTRDRLMVELDDVYPGYGFVSHKGYGARTHIDAIHRQGPCDIHRISFRIVPRVSPPGTVAEILGKRLMKASGAKAFGRAVKTIRGMRDYLHRRDVEMLRDVYRSCCGAFPATGDDTSI